MSYLRQCHGKRAYGDKNRALAEISRSHTHDGAPKKTI